MRQHSQKLSNLQHQSPAVSVVDQSSV